MTAYCARSARRIWQQARSQPFELWAILVLFVGLGVLYSVVTPISETPDEIIVITVYTFYF